MGEALPRQKFWMVWGVGTRGPTYQHDTHDAALTEAKRLARKSPDTPFVVLEAVEVIVKREFDLVTLREPVETYRNGFRVPSCHQGSDDDIPF